LANAPELQSSSVGADALFGDALWAAPRSRGALRLWLLFSAELILFAIIRLPLNLSLDAYAFADRGMFPTVCYLVTHGSRPTIDFGYPYGLLPILLTQGAFHLFGWAPLAHEAAMGVCAFASAWGMARFASAMRLGTIGIILLVAAFPFAIFASYPSLIHAMEAAVLCNGLAEQAAGRHASALALATAACFIKPAMSYLYGFLLLLLMMLDAWRGAAAVESRIDWRGLLGRLAPAALTGVILLFVLATAFGVEPLVRTLLPGTGRAEYRHMGLGAVLYGGRDLWYQPMLGPEFYLFTVAGFWITATLWILVAGARAAWKVTGAYWAARAPAAGQEFVFTCAVLHLTFITTFFGGPVSWEYYSYVLVMGVAATTIWNAASARIVGAIALLALSGHAAHLGMAATAWRTTAPSPQTAGLWASADERNAWRRVIEATAARHAMVIVSAGSAAVLFPTFEPPFGAYLAPGVTLPAELARATDGLRHAPMIFAVTSGPLGYALDFFPQFRRLLDQREVVLNEPLEKATFTVYGTVRGPR
jgi:hypothetical protein